MVPTMTAEAVAVDTASTVTFPGFRSGAANHLCRLGEEMRLRVRERQ